MDVYIKASINIMKIVSTQWPTLWSVLTRIALNIRSRLDPLERNRATDVLKQNF